MPRTELQEWPLGAIQWILVRFGLKRQGGGILLDGSHLPRRGKRNFEFGAGFKFDANGKQAGLD